MLKNLRWVAGVLLAFLIVFLATSGRFLVVNEPAKADVVVVLAGETDVRPLLGLQVLQQEYAPQMILDAPAATRIYQWEQLDLAQKYVTQLPQARQVTVCAIYGLSTSLEINELNKCLPSGVHRILLVTSDYHTRRALSTARTVLPEYQWHVASASDPHEFGVRWWQHRQWAKVNLEEWTKLVWWEVVERWRYADRRHT